MSSELFKDLFQLGLPGEKYIMQASRRICKDQSADLSEVAACVTQDPILVTELLRAANAIAKRDRDPAVTTAHKAVGKLGARLVLKVIDELAKRPAIEEEEVSIEFESLRVEARMVSIIARILAVSVNKQIASEVHTLGLLSNLGHMLASIYLGVDYTDMAMDMSRKNLEIALRGEEDFDVDEVRANYLRYLGIAEELASLSLVRGKEDEPDQCLKRDVLESSIEMVLAYLDDRWEEEYKPGAELCPGLAITRLSLEPAQYSKIYERCDKFFEVVAREEETKEQVQKKGDKSAEQLPPELAVLKTTLDYNDQVKQVAQSITRLLETAESTRDLLDMLLYFLITEGPFVRAALLMLSDTGTSADICRAVGEGFEDTESVNIDDPCNPLALGLTQLRSFNIGNGRAGDTLSPLGISSYAIAKLDVDVERPVVLYADCGVSGAVPFDARRIFRYVVDQLNNRLPHLSGWYEE